MTNRIQKPKSNFRQSALGLLVPSGLFAFVFLLYASTAAPATLFGDPAEYQFIPAIAGIAHPPGYAFYTLLARFWQVFIPVGKIAFRTNLLAAAVGAWTTTAVYLIVHDLQSSTSNSQYRALSASLFAAASLAASPDFWQHAIHANAHIVSAGLGITHIWLLIRWLRTKQNRWLAIFALTLGWAATHHPITLGGAPAYLLFILVVRPGILRQRRLLLSLVGCLLLGLTPLLYYPLHSPDAPFGPTDMHTWEGFWRHITARGLRGNLFHFGPADQFDRGLVFWSLLRLQFSLPVIALIATGLIWFARRLSKPAVLVYSFLAIHLLFTLNTVQDVMAYLLLPFAVLSIAAGIGVLALFEFIPRLPRPTSRVIHNLSFIICPLALMALPFYQIFIDLQRGISLRDFTASEEYVAAVYERFAGQGKGAILLSDWEHLTPLWVHIYTQGETLSEDDVKLVYVSTANPWVESVWAHIEEGPIYLSEYRPAVREAGFRLVSETPFYRVAAPPVNNLSPSHPLDVWIEDRVHILGYDMPTSAIQAGDSLEILLYQSAPEQMSHIWMPYGQLGPVEARWTTDSRLLTSQWLPGEVVAERYELSVPFTLPPGEYPLRLGYADLSGGRESITDTLVELATITVLPRSEASAVGALDQALANLDNQIALMEARARAGWQVREAFWDKPLTVTDRHPLHLTLTWRALASPRDSYTIFIHLIDDAGRPVAGHDYTPLGGACPTFLWFPKWLPGQTLKDPYRLSLPSDLPPGKYRVEVGMYGMTSLRRLPVVNLEGDLAGDRVILGSVRVE